MMDANCTYFGNHFTIYMSIHYAIYWWLPNFLALGTSSGEANFFFTWIGRGIVWGCFEGIIFIVHFISIIIITLAPPQIIRH